MAKKLTDPCFTFKLHEQMFAAKKMNKPSTPQAKLLKLDCRLLATRENISIGKN